MSTGALPGFRDFFPAELAERSHLFGIWREIARRFAFAEYDGPPLEPLELYTRKSGEEIVGQLYAFEDKGGRQVALRPEMTPTFARMVASRANALRKPVRWFSIPQLFRYERQQKGRLREHFQLNVDIVGETDVSADAELLAVAIEIMRGCGLTSADVRARVSDRRLLTALVRAAGVGESAVPAVFAAIDKIGREPDAVLLERMTRAGVNAAAAERVFDVVTAVVERGSAPAAEAQAANRVAQPVAAIGALPPNGGAALLDVLRRRFPEDAAVAESCARLHRYLELLAAHGVDEWVDIDLTIVRGLAYYTGIVFELFDAHGEFRAICGGGRYDTLLQALGGVDLPALGFGMGDVVLGELLRARGRMPATRPRLDVWVVPQEGVAGIDVLRVAAALRRFGLSVEYLLNMNRLESVKANAQMSTAAKAGALQALLLSAGGHAEVRFLDAQRPPLPTDVSLVLSAATADDYLQYVQNTDDPIAEILRRRRDGAR